MDVKLKQDQKDLKKVIETVQTTNSNDDFVVLDVEQKSATMVQTAQKSFYDEPYATDLDLFDKDFYKNPYLLKEKMNQDTVKLGSKTWKPNEQQKVKNQRITEAKAISKNATGYTLDLHKNILKVNKAHTKEAERHSFDAYTQYLGRLSSVHFTGKMFTSAYIAQHFMSCYEIVDNYKRFKSLGLIDHEQNEIKEDFLKNNSELFELFSKRINEFAKKNHIDLFSGDGTEQKLREDEKISSADFNRWLILIGDVKAQRNEERLNKVLESTKDIRLQESDLKNLEKPVEKVDYIEIDQFADYYEMDTATRIKSIPKLKADINAVMLEIGPEAPTLMKVDLRKELSSLQAMLRFAEAELAMYKVRQQGGDDIESLKKNFPAEVKELYAASENIRKLQKREVSDFDIVKTVNRDIGKLSREEAMSTYSDQASMKKRINILRLSDALLRKFDPNDNNINNDNVAASELNKLISKYFDKNFYKVGDRQESKAMKKVLLYIKDNDLRSKPAFSDLIKEIDSMTNGSLDFDLKNVPKHAVYYDKADARPVALTTQGMSRPAFGKLSSLYAKFTKWEDRRDEPLFPHEPTVNDLRQGKVSNCWMVSATTALINYDPQIIKNALKDNGDGTVTVRLFKHERTTDSVKTVPMYIRVKKETPKLWVGGAINTSGALWMHMLEKAAAFVGYRKADQMMPELGYNSLWHGAQGDWLFALTGQSHEILAFSAGMQEQQGMDFESQVYMHGFKGINIPSKGGFQAAIKDEKFRSELFNDILHARENGYVYTYGTKNNHATGMNNGHAYTVLGAKEVDGEKYVILRNPYGNMSTMYDEKGKLYKTDWHLSYSMNETYGQFIIKLDDFCKNGNMISRLDMKKYYDPAYAEEVNKKREENKQAAKAEIQNEVDKEQNDW